MNISDALKEISGNETIAKELGYELVDVSWSIGKGFKKPQWPYLHYISFHKRLGEYAFCEGHDYAIPSKHSENLLALLLMEMDTIK